MALHVLVKHRKPERAVVSGKNEFRQRLSQCHPAFIATPDSPAKPPNRNWRFWPDTDDPSTNLLDTAAFCANVAVTSQRLDSLLQIG
jgi:hypothetical protein